MSIRLISHVWVTSPYKGERLLLHLALADFASDEGVCWPSHSTLARKARCSVNWVRLSISQMVRDGLVEIVEPAGAGRGKVGRYRLLGHTQNDHTYAEGHTVSAVRSHSDTSDTYLLNRQEPSLSRDDFESVWKIYPKKVSKDGAWRAWQKMSAGVDVPTLVVLTQAVEKYARSITEMRYCAHLATWLSSQRWLDEITATSPTVPERVEQRISDAMSHGAAHAHSRRPENELLDSMMHRPPDEQAAALDLYRKISAKH